MHTPVATIGVRGTEFDIEVRRNSVTTVRVYEGLVAVRNNQIETSEVLVGAGKEVTVYPLRPPDPPITFEQVVAENFSRESPAEQPLLQRFLAFPDPHLDLAENPAYVSMLAQPSGRFYFYPSRSEAFSSPEVSPLSPLDRFTDLKELFATDERLLKGVSSRISYVYPLDRWVVGGLYEFRGFDHDFRFRISRRIPTVFGGDISVEQIGNSLFAPDLQSDSHSHRMLLLGARRFPGKTVALSYDWTHAAGDIDTRYEFRPAGSLLYSDLAKTFFSTDRRQFTLGYHQESDGLGSVGAFYRFGLMSGETAQQSHLVDGMPGTLAAFDSSGFHQEVGGRWRVRLHRDVHLALLGSLGRTRLEEQVRQFRTSDSRRETVFWTPTLAAGLGYNWQDRLFAALDYQYSQVRSDAFRLDLAAGLPAGSERVRRRHHGLHGWAQYHLPWGLFTGAGGTWFRAAEAFQGNYSADSTGWQTDFQGRLVEDFLSERSHLSLNQLGWSAGKRFDRLFLEYQLSQTRGPQFSPLGHSFLLRVAF
jgi:opacity protein-like surface antigen